MRSHPTSGIAALAEGCKPRPGYLRLGVSRADYPFADPDVPANKRIKRFPHDNPFSYIEYLIFMR